ncbi:MAG: HD family phosphohydrolase [Opitutales bacterium]
MAALFKRASARKAKQKALPVKKDKGREQDASPTSHFLETSTLVEAGLFLAFTALVVTITFLGQKPKGPQVIPNHPAPSRIIAEYPFEYTSAIKTNQKKSQARARVPPVFERTFKPYEAFKELLDELKSGIARAQIENEEAGTEIVEDEIEAIIREVIEGSDIDIDPKYVKRLTTETSPKERSELFKDALKILRSLYEEGIYADYATNENLQSITVIQLRNKEGDTRLPDARSVEEALVKLRVRINELAPDSKTERALYELFSAGIQPNLLYSSKGTERAIQRAVDKVEPEVIRYEEGDTLIEPGTITAPEGVERIEAYRKAGRELGNESLILNRLFLERTVLTLILLLAVYLFVRQGFAHLPKRNRTISIVAVSTLVNLLLIRLLMELGDIAFADSGPIRSMVAFVAPYALAPILVAVLVGAAPALLCALLISILFGISQNNSVEFLLIAFLSGVFGTLVATNTRKRSQVVRAGCIAGAAAAIAGAAAGLFEHIPLSMLGQQALLALVVGAVTGILAVGLLPVFEQLFKITTEITLLELTDFNHPLLRRMQMEAPGTYHHSLMVANLSENAAAAIGASPLLCRVCCFFHDIGKLVKPEYFIENQRGGVNPHQEKNPSMSALVIKAHVKEGVELARMHGLPRVIINVIRQHHGTTLIQYFYHQARQRKKEGEGQPANAKTGKAQEEIKVEESTYRYDGPRPNFKESAIIFFADGVEAASRTLKKVTQPAVDELVDNLVKERIDDGQLDECPLTFKELDEIRRSFSYTLLNMLHSRVEYQKEEKAESKNKEGESQAPQTDSDTHGETGTGNNQPV